MIYDAYLGELFAIFLLFQLLPVPVYFNVLLVGLNDFILDFVGSFLLVFLLGGAAVFIPLLSLDLDADDLLLSRLPLFLQLACSTTKNTPHKLTVSKPILITYLWRSESDHHHSF